MIVLLSLILITLIQADEHLLHSVKNGELEQVRNHLKELGKNPNHQDVSLIFSLILSLLAIEHVLTFSFSYSIICFNVIFFLVIFLIVIG